MCCSHLPSSALQILISTSGLPLLALLWQPLWIFLRQRFLHGLSAHVQSPQKWGVPKTTLGSEGSHQIPWAGRKWAPGRTSSYMGPSGGGKGNTPGDGFLANFTGVWEVPKLWCCCPEHTEVLGHASLPHFLSSHLLEHPKTEGASEAINKPTGRISPLHLSILCSHTWVPRCSLPSLGSPDCQKSTFLLLSPNWMPPLSFLLCVSPTVNEESS